jgi:hypothetical protein
MGLQLSGSVQLEGNLLVTGSANSVFENISVTNRITANEINVQFVSSSIIYSSGSNKFGDLITDTQQFTGSVDVSGSLTATTLVRRGGTSSQFLMADGSVNTNVLASGAYLPLTGGTLTGALNGTTADFTGASGAFIAVTATTTDSAGSARLRVSSTGGNINDFSSFSAAHPSRANQAWIGGDGNSLTTVLQAGGTEFLRGASTGEATFSSNVGLGVTSSAWFSDRRALQIQSGGSINGSASTPAFVELGANFFHGSLGDTYIASSQATKYRQVSGAHEWYTAPSGTSNTAINFTSSMSLTAAGRLSVGNGSPAPVGKVHIFADGADGATNSQTAYDNSVFRITPQNGSSMGLSIGYAGANLTYIQTNYSNGTVAPLRINPFGGNIRTAGNLEFESGAGIDFALTPDGSGSMTSELLNDYEEGTWTPIIGGATSESGQSYSGQTGNYTKIGRVVTVNFRVVLSDKGTITGNVSVKGLPFAVQNSVNYAAGTTYWGAFTTSWNYIFLEAVANQTYATLNGTKTAVTEVIKVETADISNATQLNGSFTYFTA